MKIMEKEKQEVKAMVYLTPSMHEAAQDLAHLNRCSLPEYIKKLIERDIKANEDKLNRFRELCETEA